MKIYKLEQGLKNEYDTYSDCIVIAENENDARNLWELREGWPSFHWYGKKDVSVFDTTAEVPPWTANKMTEVPYECILGDKCTDPKHGHLVKHVPL